MSTGLHRYASNTAVLFPASGKLSMKKHPP
jgi:hypothetical protein